MLRKKNLYNTNSTEPYKLSRSKIDLFLQCPRCFYLDRRLGISQPSGPPFTLNNAVDTLLKLEFDQCRDKRCVHPFVSGQGIEAIPFSHPELENWRNNRIGIQYLDPKTNFLLYGAIDDVWELPCGELVIVDYKAKATTGQITLEPKRKKNGEIYQTDRYLIGYVNQMEFYQWLYRKNGFRVSDIGYFLFANAIKEREAFNNRLDFEKILLPHDGDMSWVDPTVGKIKKCLDADTIPDFSPDCSFCWYAQNILSTSSEVI
ncbi:MAG: PD-(D/E)XK nuclease family protein [Waddliaceae bacterium]